jgi:hypothetical protein
MPMMMAMPMTMMTTTNLPSSSFDIVHESLQLFHIALPTVLIQFSLVLIFPMAASAVGRNSVGTTALGGLLGNLTCLSILEGALTAADTLMS